MKKYQTPLSFKIIHIITSIIYYLSIGTLFLGFILTILILTGYDDAIRFNILMPVEVSFKDVGQLTLSNSVFDVEIVEALGKIHILEYPPFFAKWVSMGLLLMVTAFYLLMRLFKKFINNVRRGTIFDVENIRLLKKLSYGLMGFWLFLILGSQFIKYTVVKNMTFVNLDLSGDDRNFIGILLLGLFIWVLSHIFIKGKELEEENKLTI
jgi:hypothetical protein